MSSQEIRPSSTERLSHRHEDVWEKELAYEIRALKLFARCTREEDSRIVCGDKSGWITCFSLEEGERAWEARAKGPVYDLSFIHPLQDGVTALDPRLQPCLVAAGTGNGELVFFDYLSGEPGAVDWADRSRADHFSKEPVLALLYVESLRELWVALSGGTIERLRFHFSGDGVSVHLRELVEVDEAVSSLCFMPASLDHPAESYGQGWICAATMLGNLYRLDQHAKIPVPQSVLTAPVSAPIRTVLSLSRVLTEHGSEGDALVFAYGGNIKYVVQKWEENAEPGALDRSCADRVLCLGRADWKDSVWLIAGGNDDHLRFYRLLDSDPPKEAPPKGKGLLNLFADRRYTIRFEERVLKVVGRDRKSLRNGDSAGLMVYVALGNHRLKAIRLLPREEFRKRLETALGDLGDLEAILKEIRKSPDDSILRRNLSALLFRARWLSRYVEERGLDFADQRRLRLVIYHLLSGIGVGGVREILSGILEIANDYPSFRREATDLARHIGKYCLDGRSFSDKSRDLDKLAKFNEDNGRDYIYDAAIYRSLLAERHYTEQEVFQLDDPITSLQSLEIPGFGSRFLLATSYWKGRVWLLDREDSSISEISAPEVNGKPVEKVQRAVVWKDESSSTAQVIVFYFGHGWTSCPLEDLGNPAGLGALQPLEGGDGDFYAYSCLVLPGGLIAAGGRTADVSLLRVAAQESGGLQLTLISRHWGDPSGQTAPVRALAYRPLGADFGELFAGCDNGACYRFPFENGRLREPQEIYPPSTSKIRVVACHGQDHLVIGDGDLLVLLRHPAGEPTAEPERRELIREWAVRLRGPVTGAMATTLKVPPKEPCLETEWDDRQVVLVSDSEGVINVLRLGDTPEHSFAARLDGGQPSSIEYLAPLASAGSPEPAEKKRTQVAVACLDQTVRILTLSHRRESVRFLNGDLAAATAANLAAVHGLSVSSRKAACGALQKALDTPNWGIPQITQAVVQKTGEAARLSEQDVRNALEEVAWKLASAHVQSESPGVLALRLRYDDPAVFGDLLKQLKDLSLGEIVMPEGKRPHIRLRYCLRFAFKILAQQLGDGREVEDGLREQMAHFVDLCHELAQSWGPESSSDNIRCKLDIVHMLCRFATPQSLEWLLGDELKPKTYHPLLKFLEDRVLNDPRLVVPFRAVQHIRRMIDHDREDRSLEEPVLQFLVPLLVRRFRNCRATQDDAWIGAEIYLCLLSAGRSYEYSSWTFVASLLREGCPPPLLELLADRQRAHPPDDERCCEVVEALSRIMNLPVGDPQANEVRRIIFERLDGIEELLSHVAANGTDLQGIFISLRTLCAVAIAFDANSKPELRRRVRKDLQSIEEPSLTDTGSVQVSDLRLLLRCAQLLLRLSPPPPGESFETARPIYVELKRLSGGLLVDAEAEADPGPDVGRTLFLTARELLRRQIQIELDFVAPIRFLQERSFMDEPIPDEEVLSQQLRGYAALHGELSESLYTLFFYKDASAKRLILEVIGREGSREILPNRSQVKRRIDTLLEPWGQPNRFNQLKQEVDKLLMSPHVGNEAVLEPFRLDGNNVAEIIPIHRESQRYGLLVFLYGRNAVPDPSKRALSRMVFQLLVSEFMRSVQTQRLLSLTFHHISSPVSAMRAILKAMLKGYIPQSGEYLEELERLAEDCRLMIDNHLNYMRIVRGIAPPVLITAFDLVEEAEFRRRIIQRKSKGSKQILRWASKPEALSVSLDKMMVGDIIQNLLDNASKYSPAQSEILLSVRSSKKDVFIEVSDAGPGLPEHVSASLYGEGVRGESDMESKRPGLGLGLYMVHRYTDWLDGAVWFETNPKSGTTFTVRLPREINP